MNEERNELNTPSGYDDKHKCAICQSRNAVTVIDTLDYVTLEAETECSKCGDKNYWAHGFFMSHNSKDNHE